jgi:phosphoglucosamine mutase
LPDAIERRIESLIDSGELSGLRAPADEIGRAHRIEDVAGRYVVFLKKTFPMELSLDGMRVVLDCANGAAYAVGPTALEELGAEVFTIGVSPNGRNINEGCGSLFPEKVAAKVAEVRADVGIALDGDADRIVMVDERGTILDGDQLLAVCARDMVERGVLRGGQVVSTVMSNLGLEKALQELGVGMLRTQVGDRYVVDAMREGGFNLGGEQSGHIVFLDHNTSGDGLITALQVLAVMRRKNRTLSELTRDFFRYPQVLVNVPIAKTKPIEALPEFMRLVERVEGALNGRGRVLVRYSGTEPLARIMVEGDDEKQIRGFADELAEALRRALGG